VPLQSFIDIIIKSLWLAIGNSTLDKGLVLKLVVIDLLLSDLGLFLLALDFLLGGVDGLVKRLDRDVLFVEILHSSRGFLDHER